MKIEKFVKGRIGLIYFTVMQLTTALDDALRRRPAGSELRNAAGSSDGDADGGGGETGAYRDEDIVPID